jgi:hypothetical protein
MTINVIRDGAWARIEPPTPDRPYWHEEDHARLTFGDVYQFAGEDQATVRDLHATAITGLIRSAYDRQDAGDERGARRLVTCAARLAEEVIGMWPPKVTKATGDI